MQRTRLVLLFVALAGCVAAGCQRPEGKIPSVVGGTYEGYASRYSEKPVVQRRAPLSVSYEATFVAYDLGDEVHIIVYAQQTGSGEYFTGLVRVAIQDPDGNAVTIYRNHAAEAVDKPIIWKPRSRGVHHVRVEFTLLGGLRPSLAFEVPLLRQPAPIAFLAIVGVGIVLAVGAVGYLLRKRQRRAASPTA